MVVAAFTMLATSVSAQYVGNKLTDNVSIGVSAGAYTPMQGYALFDNVAPSIAIQATKYFNPVFGFGVEGEAFINAKGVYHTCTLPYTTNVSGLFYVNASNLLFGYKGAPRTVELEAIYGLGWGHRWTKGTENDLNFLTSKAGVNIKWYFTSNKAWALSLKPAVVWNLDGYKGVVNHNTHYSATDAVLELSAGLTDHFKGSNGKHYMEKVKLYDADEVARLNAEINALRNAKPDTIIKTKTVVREKVVPIKSEYVVYFAKGSAELTAKAKATLDKIPAKTTADVLGAADEVSSEPFNQALSEKRAQAVADYLKAKNIKVGNVTATGKTGEIVSRVVVVTVK